jgi:hypothetical protein
MGWKAESMKKCVLLGAAVLMLCSGFAPSAHALHFRHNKNAPGIQKATKNNSPYAYLKPKKQKRPSGYYRSTLTGKMVYGKPPKR